ncbi:MAG TPA: hypothetical protein VLD37_05300 [Candidatus Bilamarchaeum sp.]|nr:hypothetical protein [Candidatus Bilamarchaeum sp.]
MSKKKALPRKNVRRIPVKTDSVSVEEQTIKRVNRTLTTIDNFLAKWDASKIKPDPMLPQIIKIRQFKEALEKWQTEAVKAKGGGDEPTRIRRLRDFVLICRMYS